MHMVLVGANQRGRETSRRRRGHVHRSLPPPICHQSQSSDNQALSTFSWSTAHKEILSLMTPMQVSMSSSQLFAKMRERSFCLRNDCLFQIVIPSTRASREQIWRHLFLHQTLPSILDDLTLGKPPSTGSTSMTQSTTTCNICDLWG